MNNIILTGFMGCGKTTIGKEIAKEYGYTFVDTDELIEKNENMTITDIFKVKGEEYFRDVETKTIEDMVNNYTDAVISTGGGLILREENANILRRLGKIVYLRISPETVYARLKNDTTRPLLQRDNVLERISTLLEQRREKYEKNADIIIDVDCDSVRAISKKIIDKM